MIEVPESVKLRANDVLTALSEHDARRSIIGLVVEEAPGLLSIWSLDRCLWRMSAQLVPKAELRECEAEAIQWSEEWDESVSATVIAGAKVLTDARQPRLTR